MDWQLPVVAVCVGLAALYVARQTWRTWSAKKGGCGGCACGKAPADAAKPTAAATRIISVEELTLRIRSRS